MSTIDEKYLGDRIKALEKSRTLQLEGNSDPNSGAECFLVYASGTITTTPTASNIINSGDIPSRAKPSSQYTGGHVHIFVRLDLLPSNLNYNQQMQIITLENKYRLKSATSNDPSYINGFMPWGYISSSSNSAYIYNTTLWSVGNIYTDSNGVQYGHIYEGTGSTSDAAAFGTHQEFRVKIDL